MTARAEHRTYRLQLRTGLRRSTTRSPVMPYLHDLGVDWLYLSPLLEARAGIRPRLRRRRPRRASTPSAAGGRASSALVAAARDARPRACSSTSCRTTWASRRRRQRAGGGTCCAHGRGSRYARLRSTSTGTAAAGGSGSRCSATPTTLADAAARSPTGDGSTSCGYYDHRFPVAAGTAADGDDPRDVHARQHYELVDWRRADARPQLPPVLRRQHARRRSASRCRGSSTRRHAEIVALVARRASSTACASTTPTACRSGRLPRPARRARPAAPSARREDPRGRRAAAATLGGRRHDRLRRARRRRPRARRPRGRGAARPSSTPGCAAGAVDWAELIHGTKRGDRRRHPALRGAPARPRARRCPPVEDAPARGRATRCAELLACFPVYRAYLPLGAGAPRTRPPRCADAATGPDLAPTLERAAADPRRTRRSRRPHAVPADLRPGDGQGRRGHRVLPLHAARPRSTRSAATRPSSRSTSTSSTRAARSGTSAMPRSMTTLSTHDTKRSEDVRARLAVLAEVPGRVGGGARRAAAARPARRRRRSRTCSGRPSSARGRSSRERLHAYAEKAAREAGERDAVDRPGRGFEARCTRSSTRRSTTTASRADARAHRGAARRRRAGRNALARSCCSSRRRACPTSTRAASCGSSRSSTPTTAARSTSSARRRLLAGSTAGVLPRRRRDAARRSCSSRVAALRLRRDRPELFDGVRAAARHPDRAADHLVALRPRRRDHRRHAAAASGSPRAAAGATPSSTCRSGAGRDVLTGRDPPGRRRCALAERARATTRWPCSSRRHVSLA